MNSVGNVIGKYYELDQCYSIQTVTNLFEKNHTSFVNLQHTGDTEGGFFTKIFFIGSINQQKLVLKFCPSLGDISDRVAWD